MIFANALRMVVDLSFYFFFAEFVVATFGGKSMLIAMLLLCLCFGILVYIQKFSQNRIFLILPVLVLFMPETFGLTLANRIALIPSIIYVIYLILKNEYGLSWDRQADLFTISWKVFLGAGLCICLAGQYELFLVRSLPMALISLFTSVLLLRMLRHTPEVYLSRQYQFRNLLLLGSVLTLAWLFSRRFVLESMGNACSFLYMHFMVPIFSFFITCIISIIDILMKLFSWLKFGEMELQESEIGSSGGVNTFSDLDPSITASGIMFERIITTLVIIALIIVAFFVFRWLATSWKADSVTFPGLDIIRKTETDRKKKEYATSTVQQVRRQYRKFLKLYQEHGERILASDTSENIAQKGSKVFLTPDILEEMREIYIRARYSNRATRTDLKKMKQINQLLREK